MLPDPNSIQQQNKLLFSNDYEAEMNYLQVEGFYVRIGMPRIVVTDRARAVGEFSCYAEKKGIEINTKGKTAKEAVTNAVTMYKESMK